MIPSRFATTAFSLVLSGMMSFLVSGISTLRQAASVADFGHDWILAWLTSWPVAFPVVLVVAPLARRVVQRLTVA